VSVNGDFGRFNVTVVLFPSIQIAYSNLFRDLVSDPGTAFGLSAFMQYDEGYALLRKLPLPRDWWGNHSRAVDV
jgi:hypothetical protein